MAAKRNRQEGTASIAPGAVRLVSPWEKIPVAAVGAVVFPIALTSLLYVFTPVRDGLNTASTAFTMLPFAVYVGMNCLLVAAGILIFRGRIQWKDLGFVRFRWLDLLFGTIAALVGLFLIYPLSTLLIRGIGLAAIKGMSYSLTGPLSIASAILIAGLVGPLAEEIIFRGFLLSLLGSRIRHRGLVGIIGVLLFTAIHIFYFGWGGTLFILLWSPLTVGLFLWRKSIYPSLVLHVINNVAAYVIIPAVTHH
jgi:membrane protease YdiL (CAAX protease family)